jgi:hypothetical protein
VTTERIKGVLTFVCDGCGDFEEAEGSQSFESLWASLKERGWRAAKAGSDWLHYCHDCQSSYPWRYD